MKPIASTLTALFILTFGAMAEEPKQAGKGDRIPDVTVKDAEGGDIKLRDAVAEKPAVLVFYRGGWCPYCTRHLMALAEVEDELTSAGLQILAISADKPSKIAETPKKDEISYTLLSDSTMEAAKAFGITFRVADDLVSKYKNDYQIDIEAASGETHHNLPHPAVFIVDKEGMIQFAHVNPDYKERLDPKEILKAAKESVATSE